nr:DUF2860 family protein [Vibrio gelatinilyticus]
MDVVTLNLRTTSTVLPLLIAITGVIAPVASHAQLARSSGLSGELSINSAIGGETSHVMMSNNVSTSAPVESIEEFWLPLGTLNYTFGHNSQQQIYVGSSRNDIAVGTFVLEAGYRQQFDSGMVWSISYLPTIVGEAIWKDPYTSSQGLQLSEATGNAYRVQLEHIAGSPLTIDMAYGTREVNNELSGSDLFSQHTGQLNRNADLYYAKGSLTLPVNDQWMIFPSAIYILDKAKGQAIANQGAGGEITSLYDFAKHSFAATLSYMNHEFDSGNPLFNGQSRLDQKYSGFFAYEYKSLWNIPALSFISLTGYNATDSNIAFYDTSDWVTSLGMNWQF